MEENQLPFEKLRVWAEIMDLVHAVYGVTEKKPLARDRGMVDQLQRAAVSVGANVAEGSGRVSPREYIRFLAIARGSCAEVIALLHLANRVGYLSDNIHEELTSLARDIYEKLSRLMSSIKKRSRPKIFRPNFLNRNRQSQCS